MFKKKNLQGDNHFSVYTIGQIVFTVKYNYYALHFLDESKIIDLQINDY